MNVGLLLQMIHHTVGRGKIEEIDTYILDVLWSQPIKQNQVFLLQNCLKINGTTLFSSKLFRLISIGPQKPQKLTASKIKYEKFGPKILIPH